MLLHLAPAALIASAWRSVSPASHTTGAAVCAPLMVAVTPARSAKRAAISSAAVLGSGLLGGGRGLLGFQLGDFVSGPVKIAAHSGKLVLCLGQLGAEFVGLGGGAVVTLGKVCLDGPGGLGFGLDRQNQGQGFAAHIGNGGGDRAGGPERCGGVSAAINFAL